MADSDYSSMAMTPDYLQAFVMSESVAERDERNRSGDVQEVQENSKSYAKRDVKWVYSERKKKFYPVQGYDLRVIENIIQSIASEITGQSSRDQPGLREHLNVLLDIYDLNVASRVDAAVFLNQYKITEKLVEMLKRDDNNNNMRTAVLELCLKWSSCSDAFCQELSKYSAVRFCTDRVRWYSSSEPRKDSKENVRCYIIIIHNMAMNKTSTKEFDLAKTVEVLEKIVEKSDAYFKVISLLTLTYFYSSADLRKLTIRIGSLVIVCIDLLREAFENTEGASKTGFHAWTLLAELTKLVDNFEIMDQLRCREILEIVNSARCDTDDQNEQLACKKFLNKIGFFGKDLQTVSVGRRQIAAIRPMMKSSLESKAEYKTVSTSTTNSVSTTDTESQTIKSEQFSGSDSSHLRALDILLIGKTGNGKSATGNMILGRNVFKSSPSLTSVTKEVDYEWVKFEDCLLKIVDGPGVADTDNIKDFDKATQFIVDKMKHAVTFSPAGYHAFLLVVKYGNRFTAEDHVCIKMLKSIFGQDFVQNFCILLVTSGDMFVADNPDKSFFTWCDEQDGIFRELLQECNNRVLLFDNKTKDVNVRYNQVKHLIETVDNLQSGGRRYTDKYFEEMASEREKFFLECKEPMIREDTVIQANFIMQDLEDISNLEEEDHRVKLIELNKRTDVLKNDILENDRGTGILHQAVETVDGILALIKDKIDLLEELANQKQDRSQKHYYIENESKVTPAVYSKKRDQGLECRELDQNKVIEEDEDETTVEKAVYKDVSVKKTYNQLDIDHKNDSDFDDHLQVTCSEIVTVKQLSNKFDEVARSKQHNPRPRSKIKTQSHHVEKDRGLVQKDTGLVQKDKGLVQKDTGLVQKDKGLVQKDKGLVQMEKGLVDKDKGLVDKDEQIKQLQGKLLESQSLALKFMSDRDEREDRLRKEVQLKLDQMALYLECKRLLDDTMKTVSNEKKSRCRLS